MGIISEIAIIEKECFSDAWSEKSLEDAFKMEHYHLVGVFEDGSTFDDFVFQGNERLAGYIIYSEVMGDVELLRIAVRRSLRRMGFGSKLMHNFISILEFRDAEKVTLEVREGNVGAIRLYTIYGFEKIAVRENYYTDPQEDAVIMQRMIANKLDKMGRFSE